MHLHIVHIPAVRSPPAGTLIAGEQPPETHPPVGQIDLRGDPIARQIDVLLDERRQVVGGIVEGVELLVVVQQVFTRLCV